MDTPDSQAPDNLLDAELDIVFYDPDRPYADKSLSSRSKSSAPTAIPKWKQLVERITSNKLLMDRQFERIEAQALLQDFSCAPFSEKPIKTAERLARDIITKDNRPARELILVSLCAVLATSSRASPEEIDQVLRVIVNSFEPRYLDRLKRGAAFANKIISALALRLEPSGHETLQLDRATQIILQAKLTVSQWSTLAAHGNQVRGYISSCILPAMQVETISSSPVLIPHLIKAITNSSLGVVQISQCLGYNANQISSLAASYINPSEQTHDNAVGAHASTTG